MTKMRKLHKKVAKHLKEDIKMFKHEVSEDKELIKQLKGKKMPKKKVPAKKMTKKMTKIGKGMKISKAKKAKLEKKAGSSNIGKYKDVGKSDFAGPSGGAAAGTYPINTRKRAKAALAYARNAPNPSGIKAAVKKKYPGLGKTKGESNGKKKK